MINRFFQKQKRTNAPDRVATLDIGSSKVACAIAKISRNAGVSILGIGQYANTGCKAGIVANMETLISSILHSVHSAEEEAQETIREVYINVSSALTQSHLITVDMDISQREVSSNDVKQLIQQAIQQIEEPTHEVIHVIPYMYKIDGSRGIKDPRGMYGETLAAKVHVVTAPLSPLRNLIACAEKAHLDVIGLIASPFASGLATLEQDEMELGTILLDIGSHSIGMGIFSNGNLVFTDTLKVGGFHLTNDLAHGLATSLSHAERLKTLYGSAIASSLTDRETIIVPQAGEKIGSGGVRMPKSSLVRIIQPRVEEIFTLIKKKLEEIGGKQFLSYRIVITGGAAQLAGIKEIAEIILMQPIRIGRPIHAVGTDPLINSPTFSCCAGQLAYIKLARTEEMSENPSPSRLESMMGSISVWFKEKM